MSIYGSVHLSPSPSLYRSLYLSLPVSLLHHSTCLSPLSLYQCLHLSLLYLSTSVCTCLSSISQPVSLPVSTCLSTCLSPPSLYLSLSSISLPVSEPVSPLSLYLSLHLSVHMSLCSISLPVSLFHRSTCLTSSPGQKRSGFDSRRLLSPWRASGSETPLSPKSLWIKVSDRCTT